MKILSAIGLLAVFTAARLQDIPDLPGLAVAIIEAVKRDAGIGPDATHPPLAWGPIVVDEETFTGIFNMLDDGAGVKFEIRCWPEATSWAHSIHCCEVRLIASESQTIGWPTMRSSSGCSGWIPVKWGSRW